MWRDTIIEENNRIFATGSNVWMNAGEIADLFNNTVASVNRAVKQVLKADVLNDYEVMKLVRLDNGLLIEFYSLELIIVTNSVPSGRLFSICFIWAVISLFTAVALEPAV